MSFCFKTFMIIESCNIEYMRLNYYPWLKYIWCKANTIELNIMKTYECYLSKASDFLNLIPLEQEIIIHLSFRNIYNDLTQLFEALKRRKKLREISWAHQHNQHNFNLHIWELLETMPWINTISFFNSGYQYYFTSLSSNNLVPLIIRLLKGEIKINSHWLTTDWSFKIINK